MNLLSNAFIWEQFFLMIGAATVSLVIFLPVIYFAFTRMDRTPKDGPRCRKCGMDLRACTTTTCTECGADLSKKGVWPIGLPKRGPAILVISLWSWLLLCLFSLGIIHLNEYQYDLFHTKYLSKNVVWLDDPLSKNDLRIIITASGKDFLLINNDTPLAVDTEQISIEIFNQGGTLAIAAINVGSKELDMPIYDYEKRELKQVWGNEEPDFDIAPATFLMDSLKKTLPAAEINDAMHDEVQQATEFALVFARRIQRLEEGQELPDEIYAGSAKDLSKPFLFESLYSTDWENTVTDTPADTIFLAFPAVCFVTWVIGMLVIRRMLYARMASNGIPDENRMI